MVPYEANPMFKDIDAFIEAYNRQMDLRARDTFHIGSCEKIEKGQVKVLEHRVMELNAGDIKQSISPLLNFQEACTIKDSAAVVNIETEERYSGAFFWKRLTYFRIEGDIISVSHDA